ncbi:glycosyltransferase family 1 protein [Aliishimia ponticola]|uniref:Glycosyltransferase family 1 protein n=1 Tax=Aliishimia ponticola TaxID=2499833 RepID=A0A4S4NER9_9RHOB|nr:glycosyltransferase [Aliishimia ponticola]THH38042.1 glycosyltransferase family 1 protein [Aliishimia ponticola]
MRVLYVTSWVMGDAGANAADIFPRLSVQSPEIDRVIVADFPKNKYHIEARQGAEYLRLEWNRTWLRYGLRIARKAKQADIDVIHIFYRQQNAALAICIRLGLMLVGSKAKIIMDHRSVNLAKGARSKRKMWLNRAMQPFVHHLAGNPWAVETNHDKITKPKHIIDLGYDQLPEGDAREPANVDEEVNVWFIGSLKPANRKSQFLIDVFARVSEKQAEAVSKGARRIVMRVAGPTKDDQSRQLNANPDVVYHGKLPRLELYELLREYPGIGLAFMNHEYHEYAPSLKFAEYAIMRYKILSSETVGLKTQAERMGMDGIRFVPEEVEAWADAIIEMAADYKGLEPLWEDHETWSYPDIYRRQVLGLYKDIVDGRV